MRPVTVTVGPLAAASANSIALAQAPTGAFTLNGSLVSGGVATIAAPSQVTLTFSANETGNNFTIRGTDPNGSLISEVIAGTGAGTVTSVLTYSTVTAISDSQAAAGNITAGNAQSGSSPWIRLDEWAASPAGIQVTVSGTVNYTVQGTFDDPNSPTTPVSPALVTWVNHPDLNLVANTATAQAMYQFIPIWARLVVNSGSGSATMTISQLGNVPR